jgi:RNA polymerase-binding protein DksA
MLAHLRPPPSRADALRTMLEARRAAVQAELEHLSHQLRTAEPREGQDEGDRANQDMQHGFDSARLQQVTRALREIDAALTRQTAGDYGQCVACGGDIPVARLRSLPTARYCRTCQEGREQPAARHLAA